MSSARGRRVLELFLLLFKIAAYMCGNYMLVSVLMPTMSMLDIMRRYMPIMSTLVPFQVPVTSRLIKQSKLREGRGV